MTTETKKQGNCQRHSWKLRMTPSTHHEDNYRNIRGVPTLMSRGAMITESKTERFCHRCNVVG